MNSDAGKRAVVAIRSGVVEWMYSLASARESTVRFQDSCPVAGVVVLTASTAIVAFSPRLFEKFCGRLGHASVAR
jgi:hypothetical protein